MDQPPRSGVAALPRDHEGALAMRATADVD
jgi:hypothetical protein